jgi:hypothetical protein
VDGCSNCNIITKNTTIITKKEEEKEKKSVVIKNIQIPTPSTITIDTKKTTNGIA